MSPLRWTCKSTRTLAQALTGAGHPVSDFVVRRLLRQLGYSLQANAKVSEGSSQHPDRDAQFAYLNDQAAAHLAAGDPVISVDAKKKENIGEFRNSGREWQPKGSPEPVNVHDFIDKELGKVTPYGIYDVAANAGWVSVGTDHDTAAFAVTTIARDTLRRGLGVVYQHTRHDQVHGEGSSDRHRSPGWSLPVTAFASRRLRKKQGTNT